MKTPKTNPSEAQLHVSFTLPKNPIKLMTSNEVTDFLFSIWDTALLNLQEQFYVIFINSANHVVCWRCLHTGTIANTTVDLRLLFGMAFGCGAVGMIIAHNHPSGNLKPSQSDISLNNRIKEAGKLLGVRLYDHFIVAHNGSFSFLESGLMR